MIIKYENDGWNLIDNVYDVFISEVYGIEDESLDFYMDDNTLEYIEKHRFAHVNDSEKLVLIKQAKYREFARYIATNTIKRYKGVQDDNYSPNEIKPSFYLSNGISYNRVEIEKVGDNHPLIRLIFYFSKDDDIGVPNCIPVLKGQKIYIMNDSGVTVDKY